MLEAGEVEVGLAAVFVSEKIVIVRLIQAHSDGGSVALKGVFDGVDDHFVGEDADAKHQLKRQRRGVTFDGDLYVFVLDPQQRVGELLEVFVDVDVGKILVFVEDLMHERD